MVELIHKILLWIHIPFGMLSLILFWIPVSMKKGSPMHKKVGWYYFICMCFMIRKTFLALLFVSGIGMILLGAIKFHFAGMGTMMVFFGLLVMPSGREFLYSKTKAMDKETKIKMHIQGTIISGIAAYTAFFAFGGSRILMDVLHLHHQWMMVPWILPSLLGFTYSWYMKRRYRVA